MVTERREYVTLCSRFVPEGRKEGNPVTYDTLGKAIEALNDLGLCMNWGISATIESSSGTILLYEGWVYKHSFESYVVLPFNEDEYGFEHHFEALLKKIFEPFIVHNDVHRSLISVVPGQDWHKQKCFFVTLVLRFADEEGKEGETAKIIQEVLGKVEDGHDNVSGRVFWLD